MVLLLALLAVILTQLARSIDDYCVLAKAMHDQSAVFCGVRFFDLVSADRHHGRNRCGELDVPEDE